MESRDDQDPGIVVACHRRGEPGRLFGSLRTVVAKQNSLDVPILHPHPPETMSVFLAPSASMWLHLNSTLLTVCPNLPLSPPKGCMHSDSCCYSVNPPSLS